MFCALFSTLLLSTFLLVKHTQTRWSLDNPDTYDLGNILIWNIWGDLHCILTQTKLIFECNSKLVYIALPTLWIGVLLTMGHAQSASLLLIPLLVCIDPPLLCSRIHVNLWLSINFKVRCRLKYQIPLILCAKFTLKNNTAQHIQERWRPSVRTIRAYSFWKLIRWRHYFQALAGPHFYHQTPSDYFGSPKRRRRILPVWKAMNVQRAKVHKCRLILWIFFWGYISNLCRKVKSFVFQYDLKQTWAMHKASSILL